MQESNYGLEKFGLRKNYSLELDTSQNEFYQKLKANIHKTDLTFWTFLSERYIRTDKPYIGSFTHSSFELKRRTRFWGSKQNHTIVSGKYYDKDGKLDIQVSFGILSSFIQLYVLSALLGLFTFLILFPKIFSEHTPGIVMVAVALFFIVGIIINLVAFRIQLKKFEKEFSRFLSGSAN